MNFKTEHLVGYQFAEFDKAERARTKALFAQVAVAILGGGSLWLSGLTTLIVIAVISLLILLLIMWLEWRYGKHRIAGEAARRATLIVDGLGQTLSVSELLALNEKMQVDPSAAKAKQPGADYYASLAPTGWMRLIQMIEQSAFFSKALYRSSAMRVGTFVLILLVPVISGFLILVPQLDEAASSQAVRLLLLLFVFVLTSGGVRTFLDHLSAASATEAVFQRASGAIARGAGEADVLSILSDYNAAVEASPLMAPGAYKANRDRLNRLWGDYERERNAKAKPPGASE